MPSTTLQRLHDRLIRLQIERPWLVVALTLLSLLPAAHWASRLTLRSSFSELLPDNRPSVVEARRVSERLAGSATLTLVAQGADVPTLKRFVEAVAPKLRALRPELVGGVDDGTRVVQRFFETNKHLYADLADIQKLHDRVIERYDYEVQKAAGLDLELGDEPPPKIDAKSVSSELDGKLAEARASQPGTDGYYLGHTKGGLLAAVLVRTPLGGFDARVAELEAHVLRIGETAKKEIGVPALRLGITGDLITSREQHAAITSDLAEVGTWGVGLILGVVLLFFLRLRVLFSMTLTIFVGCLWAFGAAYFSVGYLNMASGFLVSVIAGNGINFGIVFMARYLEARRGDKQDTPSAIATSHRETWLATLAAAGAGMIAYGSLSITDFQGFRHFGILGGVGMMQCWVATYWLLPAILVLSERYSPMFVGGADWRRRVRGVYGIPFAWVTNRAPRLVLVLGAALTLGALALCARYFSGDPMEYDLATIRNDRTDPTSAGALQRRVDDVVGRLGQDGRAILVDRLEQVEPLVRELERRRKAAPVDRKPFEKVVTIFDVLPRDQEKKLELLRETLDRIERARARGMLSADEVAQIQKHLPPKLEPIGIQDLPELVARSFTERDGTRGRIVYIVPKLGRSVYDAHYLDDWAASFREVRLPDGSIVRGSGDPVIFSDMLTAIREESPKAIAVSLIGTLAVILLAFRARLSAFLCIAVLFMGLSWLGAFFDLRGVKLNFLNFVALPISIGVGADYAINLLRRHELTGGHELRRVVVETGGALVLCSLTTVFGYLALLSSINGAVRSFGLAAAMGELSTLFAAVLVLPAWLEWRARRRAAAATS